MEIDETKLKTQSCYNNTLQMFTLDRNSIYTDNENFFNYILDFNNGLRIGYYFQA